MNTNLRTSLQRNKSALSRSLATNSVSIGPASAAELIPTVGELLSDGNAIELVCDANRRQLNLLLSHGTNQKIAPQIDHGGKIYIPLRLEPSLVEAVMLPAQAVEYGSTSELFSTARELFTTHGFPDDVALAVTYHGFSTWFPDCLAAAPCLLIAGPRPEATLLLQLLGCLVRRPLPLIELSAAALASLPMQLYPTLLIDHELLSASKRRLLSASNNRQAFILRNRQFVNTYCAKAIYTGLISENNVSDEAILQVNLTPFSSNLPVLRPDDQQRIAGMFQPKLLMYRIRNIAKVRASTFDLPGLPSGLRLLAHVLGSCMVDAPELQHGLQSLLQNEDERSRAQRFRDSRCVAIEAALASCHTEKMKKAYVGKLTDTANAILRGRGQTRELIPNEMGDLVRALGFIPRRGSEGYAIELTDDVRRKIHRLARDYRVAAMEDGVVRCPYCAEVLKAGAGNEQSVVCEPYVPSAPKFDEERQ